VTIKRTQTARKTYFSAEEAAVLALLRTRARYGERAAA
jgi:hypothetical protein